MATLPGEEADEQAFLDSVEGEISFFRSVMRARPVGLHRHFNIIAVRSAIQKDTGRWLRIESIWTKLRSCYNLDTLESIDLEANGYISPKSSSTPVSIGSPPPTENLALHPFFREEFSLPYEEFEPIIAPRRLRATASLPSSPAPSSPAASLKPASNRSSVAAASTGGRSASAAGSSKRGLQRGKRKAKTKTKLSMAGLVGGDSDSSALTQESADEGAVAGTPKESVITGTDAGTEYGDDEDVEMRDASSTREASPRPAKGRTTKGARKGRSAATNRPPPPPPPKKKKQKR